MLFIEFVNWAFNKKLDLDDDDDADDFESVPKATTTASKNVNGNRSQANPSPIKKSGVASVSGKTDDIWKTLEEKLPWRTTPEHKAKRDLYWTGFDVNGNGYLSLAEIDKGIQDVV